MPNTDMSTRHKRFKKLMVANRGEIAIRVLRAATELHIRTVAIFTYEDRYSLHRYKADEAYQIGENDNPLKPYLDIEEIIRVAKENGVDAIHPGYGFLSENADFARRCRDENIVFVGPTPEVMDRLGDKMQAKILARTINVPLIEDSQIDLDTREAVLSEAERIGLPIMIKAAAGGGGRGMRVVRESNQILGAWQEARNEARNAFGNDTVFFEEFIDNPKHIEVQLLGDTYGNLVHLYERDCSVQRRFQKVVEIAPSISLSQPTRDKLYAYALAIGNEVGYSCAGTVEFLVDSAENIYFIEVNPRIQVEHTVTEEVTGIDLVRSQILVAEGYELSHPTIYIRNQNDVHLEGFAIQCRITTEDPSNGFKPDYGKLIHYRSPGGFGIRLDAGSAYTGSNISPYFDSMLVKVTSWGRTYKGAIERLQRAMAEFRIRGVQTNIGFLENLLRLEAFQSGKATVNLIGEHPELLVSKRKRDRGTKLLDYLGHVIVNGNSDTGAAKNEKRSFRTPVVPKAPRLQAPPPGSRQRLKADGPQSFAKWLRNTNEIQYTDTTFRDAHQSLLATRMRTIDMMAVAEAYAHQIAPHLLSLEMWGGATFDVAMRFLKECPWDRLDRLRAAIPNVCFQMLLRGSNAVGYTAYPDNVVRKFVADSAEHGMDIFRIFDSLNNLSSMSNSIDAVLKETSSIAEVCVCYTGDLHDPTRAKYHLPYYIDMAKRIEDTGAHILGVKDMAGLLKPSQSAELIAALRESVGMPVHLHTHDTASVQTSTYLNAVTAGVDAVDLAIASMSGLTSQPNFNTFVAVMENHPRNNPMPLADLNKHSDYWEAVRQYYFPFESDLRNGTAEVYQHEIPGGQYSNLRPQARSLGLEDQFDTIKSNFALVNKMLGDIVKVTPSSKVVGDFALFMTANKLTAEDIYERGDQISFPDSVKEFLRGDLGLPEGGFPEDITNIVLKGEKPHDGNLGARLAPVDFELGYQAFTEQFETDNAPKDYMSYLMYPKVFTEYHAHLQQFDDVSRMPSPAFFYGLRPNEELIVEIERGKSVLVTYLNMTDVNPDGMRTVFFLLNGQSRSVEVRDLSQEVKTIAHKKADGPGQIGAPLPGNLSKIYVKVGDKVAARQPLFTIEAMKMENTITANAAGTVTAVALTEKTLVQQDDLVVTIE